jgi:hypothetical protein
MEFTVVEGRFISQIMNNTRERENCNQYSRERNTDPLDFRIKKPDLKILIATPGNTRN